MFESRISAGAKEKLPRRPSGKLDANISSLSYDMEGQAKKCVERFCELANKTTQQFYKVATPCNTMHRRPPIQGRRNGICWRMSKVCSQIVPKCLYLARIGRPDIFWSANTFACAVTIWIKACDKRSARLISHIHHMCEYRQYCCVGKHSTTMQIRIVSRFRFCRRS